jgi:hypothetical protein
MPRSSKCFFLSGFKTRSPYAYTSRHLITVIMYLVEGTDIEPFFVQFSRSSC